MVRPQSRGEAARNSMRRVGSSWVGSVAALVSVECRLNFGRCVKVICIAHPKVREIAIH